MDKFNIIAEQKHQTVMAHYDALPREDKGYQSEAALEAEFISQLTEQGYERVNITSEEALLKNLRQQMERLNRLTSTPRCANCKQICATSYNRKKRVNRS